MNLENNLNRQTIINAELEIAVTDYMNIINHIAGHEEPSENIAKEETAPNGLLDLLEREQVKTDKLIHTLKRLHYKLSCATYLPTPVKE